MGRLNKTFAEFSPKIITKKILQIISFLVSSIALLCIVYEVGFLSDVSHISIIYSYYYLALFTLMILNIIRYLSFFPKKQRLEIWIIDFIFFGSVILLMTKKLFFNDTDNELLLFLEKRIWIYFLLFYAFYKEFSFLGLGIIFKYLNPALIFVMSFIFLIMFGTFLLLLPNATYSGISVMNSLFTSTSAVCVTGLNVVDFQTCFTLFGQIIVLGLIQAGGLGIMTFTSFFTYLFKGTSTFHSQLAMSDMANSETLSELYFVLRRIILVTLIIEATGALLIFINMPDAVSYTIGQKIFFSVFHSVSAFCNAGFSTLSNNLYDINFRFNYPIHLVISFLIIFGGLGFPIIFNFIKYMRHLIINRIFKLNKRKESIHKAWVININTRIVTITTFLLLVTGTLIFFLLEYNNTLAEHHGVGKIITSFFSIVTPRTAGFNSINFGILHVSTILFIMLLMWIGASPASTGGGIKTTTFAISILNIFSLAKGKDRVELFRRQVSESSMRRAYATIFLSFIVLGISIFCVSALDPEKKLMDIAFECFSAYGTVGLSMGITPTLSEASKLIIVLTMFVGRIGMLTLLIAFFRKILHLNYHYPIDNILIN